MLKGVELRNKAKSATRGLFALVVPLSLKSSRRVYECGQIDRQGPRMKNKYISIAPLSVKRETLGMCCC